MFGVIFCIIKRIFLLLNETLNIYIFLSDADFAANDMITFFLLMGV